MRSKHFSRHPTTSVVQPSHTGIACGRYFDDFFLNKLHTAVLDARAVCPLSGSCLGKVLPSPVAATGCRARAPTHQSSGECTTFHQPRRRQISQNCGICFPSTGGSPIFSCSRGLCDVVERYGQCYPLHHTDEKIPRWSAGPPRLNPLVANVAYTHPAYLSTSPIRLRTVVWVGYSSVL